MGKRHWMISSAVGLSLALSACGGGGSSGGPISTPSPTPTPTPPPPSSFDTTEYRNSDAAVAHNALAAYDQGATGAGVRVAIVDTGINTSLPDFENRVSSASADVAGTRGLGDSDGHGTAVSAIIAGANDGIDTHGVAPDATIIAYRTDSPGTCATATDCVLLDSNIAAAIDQAISAQAVVINLSLGGGSSSQQLLDAMQRAVDAGIILVIAAGNDGATGLGTNPDVFALEPATMFPGQVIIAGSVGADDGSGGTDLTQISDFSNRAGSGAEWYLAALGYRIQAPDQNGDQFLWSGTSFATPVITGAVALLKEAFPNLTPQEIVTILFESADDLGATGTDTTFGRGRLNIEAAFQPSGTMVLAGTREPLSMANGRLPQAAGDAMRKMSVSAIGLDRFNRAYELDLGSTLGAAAQRNPLGETLARPTQTRAMRAGNVEFTTSVVPREAMAGLAALDGHERLGMGHDSFREARFVAGSAIARLDDDKAVALGFGEGAQAMQKRLAQVGGPAFLAARNETIGGQVRRDGALAYRQQIGAFGVGLAIESGEYRDRDHTGILAAPYRHSDIGIDWRYGETGTARLGFGLIEEQESWLGGRLEGPFGSFGSTTHLFSLAWRENVAGLSIGIEAQRGWSRMAGSNIGLESYSLDVARRGLFAPGDSIALRLSQPLRVASGGLNLTLPTGWDYASETAQFGEVLVPFTPSGRELTGELAYGTGLWGGTIDANLYYRRDPGHIAATDDDVGAAIRFTLGL